jgi:predicted MFS family arabinose efflux permease
MVRMRRLLFLACAVVFMDTVFFAALTPLLPDYRADLAMSESAIGVLSGSYAAGTLVMALPAGWFAARFSPRGAVLAGLVGIGIFSPIFGFADQVWLLDGSRFLQGGSGALMWAGAMSWVISAGPDAKRGEMVGTVVAAAVVGELLGAPVGALAHQIGTEPVFGAVLITAAALFAFALTIPSGSNIESQSLRQAAVALRRSSIWPAVIGLAAPSFAFGVVLVLGPLQMDDLGASPFLIAGAFAAGSIAESVIGPIIGRYSDRVGRSGPYLVGVAITGAALLALGAFAYLPVSCAAIILVATGAGLAFTPAIALVTDVAEHSGLNQGYASGASNAAWGGGQMLGSISGGALAGIGLVVPAVVTAVVLALGAVFSRSPAENDQPASGEGVDPARS